MNFYMTPVQLKWERHYNTWCDCVKIIAIQAYSILCGCSCFVVCCKHQGELLGSSFWEKANRWPMAIFTFDFLPMYVWANQSESIAFKFAMIWPWKTHTNIYPQSYHGNQPGNWSVLIQLCWVWSRHVKFYSSTWTTFILYMTTCWNSIRGKHRNVGGDGQNIDGSHRLTYFFPPEIYCNNLLRMPRETQRRQYHSWTSRHVPGL